MEASRQLDAEIAEKVMGWSKVSCTLHHSCPGQYLRPGNPNGYCHAPKFSESIEAAWPIIDELRRRKYEVEVRTYRGHWRVVIVDNGANIEMVEADTAPLAICLAALQAHQGQAARAEGA